MIHFNFTVSDADAEMIFTMMRERIDRNNMAIIEHMSQSITEQGHEEHIEAYRLHNEHVEGLIKKMTNTWVEQ